MASGSRTLKLSILADIDNLKKNLNQADNEVQGFGGKLEKFGKVAAAAFAAAAAPTVINTTVNTGAVLSSEQDLERYIQDAVGNVIKLGNGVVPRGSVILLQ